VTIAAAGSRDAHHVPLHPDAPSPPHHRQSAIGGLLRQVNLLRDLRPCAVEFNARGLPRALRRRPAARMLRISNRSRTCPAIARASASTSEASRRTFLSRSCLAITVTHEATWAMASQ
jgi:hypothetical protein